MLYALGVDTDSTFIHFLSEATRRGVRVQSINLRAVVAAGTWRLSIPDDGDSYVEIRGERITLSADGSYYCRIIDLSSVQDGIPRASLWRNIVLGLNAWLESIPGRVINRPGAHAHNFAKPLHEAYLSQCGFRVPRSLTSSDAGKLLAFAEEGATVVKPVCGMRANTRLVRRQDLETFTPAQGPIHLQRYISGPDVRAHVVAGAVHAERIEGDGVDYRASKGELRFAAHQLPAYLAQLIIDTTAAMGLVMAGWDFKIDEEGNYWCLEANPMPGYDGYDRRLGGVITDALLAVLEPVWRNTRALGTATSTAKASPGRSNNTIPRD